MGIETNKKLAYLSETKDLIKAALIEKGQTVADTDTFRSYADKILSIVTVINGGGTTEGNLKMSSGAFIPDSENNVRQTVNHGLGEMPDFVFVYFGGASTIEVTENAIHLVSVWGMNSKFAPLGSGAGQRGAYSIHGCYVNTGDTTSIRAEGYCGITSNGMDELPEDTNFDYSPWIATPDENTFEVGANAFNPFWPGGTYYWIAMSGIGATAESAENLSF